MINILQMKANISCILSRMKIVVKIFKMSIYELNTYTHTFNVCTKVNIFTFIAIATATATAYFIYDLIKIKWIMAFKRIEMIVKLPAIW